MKNITFREGNGTTDNDRIAALCGLWWSDSLFYKTFGVEYDPEMSMYSNLHDAGMLVTILGEDENGEIVACYAGAPAPYQFNTDITVATEIVWCVHPDHRNGSIALQLIKQIDKVMELKGVDFYNLCISQEDKFESMGKYLERKAGFTRMDQVYFKEVGNG
ncbi:MAG: GNAT family N-acetyltransferase [Desulfobacteraceae bacterium]|nr:GNAT family N-acetyltransferase [Desulfobacteraceae bacterium]